MYTIISLPRWIGPLNRHINIPAFTGRPSSPPISILLRSSDYKAVSVSDAICEKALNISALVYFMDELHPTVQSHVSKEPERMRKSTSKGSAANLTEGDLVLVAREDFFEGEKLCLRWRGPRKVGKELGDFVFRFEYLQNCMHEDIHASRLKFYSDKSLDEKVILSYVLSSENGMPVSRLLRTVEQDDYLLVAVRRKGLSKTEDALEHIIRVYEDVSKLLIKLLDCANTPSDLREKAHAALGL